MTSSIFRIPLNAFAEQFQIEIDGKTYQMRTHWNDPTKRWTLDIGRSGEEWLVCNIALVAGVDLLAQHRHLGFTFGLYVQVDGDPYADVGEDGFGDEASLLVVLERE